MPAQGLAAGSWETRGTKSRTRTSSVRVIRCHTVPLLPAVRPDGRQLCREHPEPPEQRSQVGERAEEVGACQQPPGGPQHSPPSHLLPRLLLQSYSLFSACPSGPMIVGTFRAPNAVTQSFSFEEEGERGILLPTFWSSGSFPLLVFAQMKERTSARASLRLTFPGVPFLSTKSSTGNECTRFSFLVPRSGDEECEQPDARSRSRRRLLHTLVHQ